MTNTIKRTLQFLESQSHVGAGVMVLAALMTAGTLMNSRPAPAAAPIPVTVTPLPFPVTGAVNAAQTGAWNVGIAGTPNVNIANSPNVNLPVGETVLGGKQAVPFVNINDGRQVIQRSIDVSIPNGAIGGPFPPIYTVPPGKRLVIEFVDGILFALPGQNMAVTIATSVGGLIVQHTIWPPFIAPQTIPANDPSTQGIQVLGASQQVRLYADPGTVVSATVIRPNSTVSQAATGPASAIVTISGYLVDVP